MCIRDRLTALQGRIYYNPLVTGYEIKDRFIAGNVIEKAERKMCIRDSATMYIKFNPEKGRPYRYDTNTDNAQQVAPSNESRTDRKSVV